MNINELLTAMLDHADLLMVEGRSFLLCEVTPNQIDALAAYGSGQEDLESGGDEEPADAAAIDRDRAVA